MATYVLVPGAWLGGWVWQSVARRLRARGHEVYPVTLTGVGKRVHLARPEVDLETHIADVVNLMEAEELSDVVLVGHSYAGIVVTGVADRAGDRLAQLVYLDSAPFEDGAAYLDVSPHETREATRRTVAEHGDGWRLPFPPLAELGQQASLSGLDGDARRQMTDHAVAHPFRTYTQPLHLTRSTETDVAYRHVLIACEDMRALIATGMPRFQGFIPPAWRREDLETGHWPMVSAPDDLTALLDRLAR